MFRHPLFALQENKMKDHHVKLTETDREILKSYSTMLEGLSMYLGEGYDWCFTVWRITQALRSK